MVVLPKLGWGFFVNLQSGYQMEMVLLKMENLALSAVAD